MKDAQVEPITALLKGEVRIVELTALKPNPNNPKDISKGKLERLRLSLGELGYLIPILVNKSYQIIDGHQRIKALKAEGFERVEVRIVDLDEDSALLALLATDQTYGTFDKTKRQDIVNLLELREARLEILADYIKPTDKPDEEDEEESDPDVNEVTEIEYGDVIKLGKHMLICGDAKDPDIWKKLGCEPYLLCTSPPYFNQRKQYAEWSNIEEYLTDMETIHRLANEHMLEDQIHAVNIGTNVGIDLPSLYSNMLEGIGLTFQDQIIWKKVNATYNTSPRNAQIRTNHLYFPAYQWEPIYIYKQGKRHKFNSLDTNEVNDYCTNVWEFDIQGDRTHPAPFPLELPLRVVKAYTSPNDVVLDPFIGSGTTLFACEELNRKCIGIELMPEYCMLIINKWRDAHGE